jgi:hypothetical protein
MIALLGILPAKGDDLLTPNGSRTTTVGMFGGGVMGVLGGW